MVVSASLSTGFSPPIWIQYLVRLSLPLCLQNTDSPDGSPCYSITINGDNSPISLKLVEFGGEIEAREAKQYAESIPTCHDTQEGEQDAKSVSTVTIIDSEPQSGLKEADQSAVTICLEVQNGAGEQSSEADQMEANQNGVTILLEVQTKVREQSSKTDEIMAWMENAEKATNKGTEY